MIIHVIEPGETINTIADLYGVSAQWILKEHGIMDPNDLVVGGTLVILYPRITHTIVQGDTLESIASMYNVTVMSLLRNNSYLSDQEYLEIGDTIVIEYEDEKLRDLTVTGYCYPFIDEDVLRKTLPFLTYLVIYSTVTGRSGNFQEMDDEIVIEYARTYGVAPVMIISFDEEEGVSKTEILHNILNEENLSNTFMNNIINALLSKEYSGFSLTPLYIYPRDRQLYVEFMEELIERIHGLGLKVFDTIIPGTFELVTEIFNTQEYIQYINQLVDGSIIFPVNIGIRLDAPVEITSYNLIEDMINYYLEYIPPQELQLGINTVGYIWELPYTPGFSEGNSISPRSAFLLARDYNIPILFNEGSQIAYFIFIDRNQEILVTFRDARSYANYLELVNKYDLDGIGVWNTMSFIHVLWLIVNSQYDINKVDL